jgi:hypothetical protein
MEQMLERVNTETIVRAVQAFHAAQSKFAEQKAQRADWLNGPAGSSMSVTEVLDYITRPHRSEAKLVYTPEKGFHLQTWGLSANGLREFQEFAAAVLPFSRQG